METLTKVGLLGCGSIGHRIAQAVQADPSLKVRLCYLYDRDVSQAEGLEAKLKTGAMVSRSIEEFLGAPFDLLLECASQEAVRNYAHKALRNRKDLLIMSVGALMEDGLRARLRSLAAEQLRTIHIPSGAIGGLDIIKAAKEGELREVKLTTRKNPSALAGAPYFRERRIDPGDLREKVTLYKGPAKEAVRLFPANVNVAAVLSLMGLGGDKTKVKIVADPELSVNVHEIDIKGSFGKAKISVENFPDPKNPKTSALAALSAIETLRRACAKGSSF
jgi:aspartate dehydrogenase